MVHILRVAPKGRTVLPASLRTAAHIEEGDVLVGRIEGDRIVLESRASIKARLLAQAAVVGGGDIVQELLVDRRADALME